MSFGKHFFLLIAFSLTCIGSSQVMSVHRLDPIFDRAVTHARQFFSAAGNSISTPLKQLLDSPSLEIQYNPQIQLLRVDSAEFTLDIKCDPDQVMSFQVKGRGYTRTLESPLLSAQSALDCVKRILQLRGDENIGYELRGQGAHEEYGNIHVSISPYYRIRPDRPLAIVGAAEFSGSTGQLISWRMERVSSALFRPELLQNEKPLHVLRQKFADELTKYPEFQGGVIVGEQLSPVKLLFDSNQPGVTLSYGPEHEAIASSRSSLMVHSVIIVNAERKSTLLYFADAIQGKPVATIRWNVAQGGRGSTQSPNGTKFTLQFGSKSLALKPAKYDESDGREFGHPCLVNAGDGSFLVGSHFRQARKVLVTLEGRNKWLTY